jgi:predicted O-methyltransferase YrrM
MSIGGTHAHRGLAEVPAAVAAATRAALGLGFGESCLPAHGRLLALLAAGVGDGLIGETGTGCGVGLAWLASGAAAGARLVSAERDPGRAAAARAALAGDDRVSVLDGDWTRLAEHGPYDLLVLDGGGQGKGDEPSADVDAWLRPGGLVVVDDFTPFRAWPPEHQGRPDLARLHWLRHPRLLATEIPLTPTMATVVARYTGPGTY